MNEFIQNSVSGIIGGIIVLIFQKIWDSKENRKIAAGLLADKMQEEAKKKIIDPSQQTRYVHADIVNSLLPGTSITKMKEILGVANYKYKGLYTPYDENFPEMIVYDYEFINAKIRIASVEDESIALITIESLLIESHPINCLYPLGNDEVYFLGDIKITASMIDQCKNSFSQIAVRDVYFGIEVYYGRIGRYFNFTYIGSDVEKCQEYGMTKDISIFLNSTIYSFCVSSTDKLVAYQAIH